MRKDSKKSACDESVAIKVMKKSKIYSSENGLKCLLNEIRVHWSLELCSGVLKLLSIFEDGEQIYLVLEY